MSQNWFRVLLLPTTDSSCQVNQWFNIAMAFEMGSLEVWNGASGALNSRPECCATGTMQVDYKTVQLTLQICWSDCAGSHSLQKEYWKKQTHYSDYDVNYTFWLMQRVVKLWRIINIINSLHSNDIYSGHELVNTQLPIMTLRCSETYMHVSRWRRLWTKDTFSAAH